MCLSFQTDPCVIRKKDNDKLSGSNRPRERVRKVRREYVEKDKEEERRWRMLETEDDGGNRVVWD